MYMRVYTMCVYEYATVGLHMSSRIDSMSTGTVNTFPAYNMQPV